jgi:spore coat polysaccharide biosynthesis protein SpsF
MTQQLLAWKGAFGTAYTDRNRMDYRLRVPGFRRMVGELALRRVLEVGCNSGHNLRALGEVLGPEAEIVGVEPNDYARQVAAAEGTRVVEGSVFQLPFEDGYFDLVFTAGVLIHLATEDLPAALKELYRCSRRYLLAVEYFAEQETMITYRGWDNLLWKRDFLGHYRRQFPDLTLVDTGTLNEPQVWDDCTWWLLDKRTAP